MRVEPLLLEIGCEEIPARMIPAAASELARRLAEILDRAGLQHGATTAWGGSRRLAVRVEGVADRQQDREELVLGPPAAVAFESGGKATAAALGFARKLGASAEQLITIENEKGAYAAVRRSVRGRSIAEILAEAFPPAVAGMPFPKTMRWGSGAHRWVRPVHWFVALHGSEPVPLELFGIEAGRDSAGHRFLGAASVPIAHPDRYAAALEEARVVIDPGLRRERLTAALEQAATGAGGRLIGDAALLDEVVDLVEWPGVVAGGFDAAFLDLPRELLVTTLRHHQKCFSVQDERGALLPLFLAVANTDADPAGHVRRGNEWVVGGRLEDARFFWNEDRQQTLAARLPRLEGVAFHAKCGSYRQKSERLADLAERIADSLSLDRGLVRQAARLAKADLVSSLVGEFPELQGVIGGLLLQHEGADPTLARAVYEHYRPLGPDDPIAATAEGAVVALADRLDTVAQLIMAGERPTSSRDPLGLRRSANGAFRIVLGRSWPLSLQELWDATGSEPAVFDFLFERLQAFLRDDGYTGKEVLAVLQPQVSQSAASTWSLPDLRVRLDAIKTVRDRQDFRDLVKLVERVDHILSKNRQKFEKLEAEAVAGGASQAPARERDVEALVERIGPLVDQQAAEQRYTEILTALSRFVEPVELFFQDVMVIDPDEPAATLRRRELLARLKSILTRYFDIRELAGQADRRE